jgi:hypothetical protein
MDGGVLFELAGGAVAVEVYGSGQDARATVARASCSPPFLQDGISSDASKTPSRSGVLVLPPYVDEYPPSLAATVFVAIASNFLSLFLALFRAFPWHGGKNL